MKEILAQNTSYQIKNKTKQKQTNKNNNSNNNKPTKTTKSRIKVIPQVQTWFNVLTYATFLFEGDLEEINLNELKRQKL